MVYFPQYGVGRFFAILINTYVNSGSQPICQEQNHPPEFRESLEKNILIFTIR